MFKNLNSKRENPFRKIYDAKEYKNVLQYKDNLPKFPYLVDLEPTNNCNLRCIFCGQQAMTRKRGFMSEDTLKKVVDECVEYGTPIRFIGYGEPFLHPKIIDFVKYIKSKGLLIHITSNGLAMKKGQIKSLLDHGLDSMLFSFQGATKEQYEVMRCNDKYDELKANIIEMVKLRADKEKPFIHISSTMTNETEEDIKRFVDYWTTIADSVGIGKTSLFRVPTHQIKSIESIVKIEHLKKQSTIRKIYRPCTEVYQKLSVDWEGIVSCCCNDFDNSLEVGKLGQSSLSDIWNNSKELRLVREMLDINMYKSLTLCSVCYHSYEDF